MPPPPPPLPIGALPITPPTVSHHSTIDAKKFHQTGFQMRPKTKMLNEFKSWPPTVNTVKSGVMSEANKWIAAALLRFQRQTKQSQDILKNASPEYLPKLDKVLDEWGLANAAASKLADERQIKVRLQNVLLCAVLSLHSPDERRGTGYIVLLVIIRQLVADSRHLSHSTTWVEKAVMRVLGGSASRGSTVAPIGRCQSGHTSSMTRGATLLFNSGSGLQEDPFLLLIIL